ncbi:MAG: PucR family transcriptional regulator [Aminipila sp.]
MVTCKQLMELDIFHNVKLKAGKKGLNRTVSWAYAKHTKTITPWVQGGEFILVSGYEYGTNESELLQLIEEASLNNSSGILVEGGINFKEIPGEVIRKADEEKMPLFFVKGVISFLDVTRDISELITENRYLTKKNISLLDQLLNSGSLTQKEVNQLFYGSGISPDSCFMLAVFSIRDNHIQLDKHTMDRADRMVSFSRGLQKHISALFEDNGIKEIYKVNLDSVDYLIYCDKEEELLQISEHLKKINSSINIEGNDYDSYLSFSRVMQDSTQVLSGLHQAYFTGDLLSKKLFPEKAMSFSELGGYQLVFFVENQKDLVTFRDQYLKKLYEADQESSSRLLDTLREYLIQGGNAQQTAKKMFIHRNTLQYRMERIGAITNKNINDFNIKRDFLNAFMILDIFPFL